MTTLVPKFDQGSTNAINRSISLKLQELITVEDFGAVGDGVTDDSTAIQNAFNWSATNRQAIFLQDKRYYVSTTINCNNSIIRSISGQPGSADPYFLGNSSGSFYYGSPNSSYYMNYSPGVSLTWAQFVAYSASGCCIISDYDGDILQITGANSFNIEGIGVVGYHRATSQCGIASAVGTTQTSFQYLNNVNVIGCGAAGINFRMGLQEGVLESVNCIFNNGTGMNVTYTSGVQCAVDYNIITNCHFQYNRTNGIFFSYVDKHLYITGCDFSANGQYANGQQPGGSYVDPLLGYDRTPPTNVANMAAGIWINDADATYNGGLILDVSITNCEGELMAVGVHIRAKSYFGSIQFLRMQNVCFYRDPLFPYSGGNNGTTIFLDVNGITDSLFSQIYNQSLDYIDFPSGIPPVSSSTTYNTNTFLDGNINSNASAALLAAFLSYQYPAAFGTAGYTVSTLPVGSKGMRTYVTDANSTTFNSTVAGSGSNTVPVFYNGSNWVIG